MKTVFFSIALLVCFAGHAFTDVPDTARRYVDEHALLADYEIVALPLGDEDAILCYVPFFPDADLPTVFLDAVLVQVQDDVVTGYLKIQANGLIRTQTTVLLDFSEPVYRDIRFKGWMLSTRQMMLNDTPVFAIDLAMTNDGTTPFEADTALPAILWNSPYGLAVTYGYSTTHTVEIKYDWREDAKITLARSGLAEDEALIDPLSTYEYLASLSAHEARIVVNTLYALHGVVFPQDEWNNFFSAFAWYHPDPDVTPTPEILDPNQQRLLAALLD